MAGVPMRRLTVDEKLALLAEYDCVEFGQRTRWCRERGLQPTMVSRWARERDDGLMRPSEKKESRIALTRAERLEYEQQKQRIADLEGELARSQNAVEILGKASALLESLTKGAQLSDPHPPPPESPPVPGWARRYEK